jgi:Tol biopolymer transport system component
MTGRAVILITTMAAALVVASGVASSAVALVWDQPAEGQNGRIVYVQNSSSADGGGLYTIPAGGGAATKVIGDESGLSGLWDPAFSPDGKKIAFSANDGNDDEIYTVPLTGGTPTKVTNNTTQDVWPDWSPSGGRIVYNGYNANGIVEIYTIPSTGGTPTKVVRTNTHAYAFEPAWSPDGRKIAYRGYDGDWEIFTVPVTGGTPTNVTNNSTADRAPNWSPDSKTIVYSGNDPNGNDADIFTIPSTGGTPTNVTKDTVLDDKQPAFSPDGTEIVYGRGGGYHELYSIPASGGTPTRVSTYDTWHEFEPDWGVATDYGVPFMATVSQNFIENSTLPANGDYSYSVTHPLKLSWSATDPDGIARYQLQERKLGGSITDEVYADIPLPTATTTTITRQIEPLHTYYQYRIRAQDTKGNWGPWVVGSIFSSGRDQENPYYTGGRLKYYPSNWNSIRQNGAYFERVASRCNCEGGSAVYTGSFRNVAWVATRAPDGGLAYVYIDGVYKKTVSLRSSSVQPRSVVFAHDFGDRGQHTVEIRVPRVQVGSSLPRTFVTLDAFITLQ